MSKIKYSFLFSLVLSSCSFEESNSSNFYNFNYDFEIRRYNSEDLKNHVSSDFFLNGKVIFKTGREIGCVKYYYNLRGDVVETRRGRTCEYGKWRKFFIYDFLNNHTGYYSTTDSIVNLDTIAFNQIYFYDSENRLIKELSNSGRTIKGEEFEIWKFYTYRDSLIETETTTWNNDTTWIGKYYYDSNRRLNIIHRTQKEVYETEIFIYHQNGLLAERAKVSTENPVTPITSFSAGNLRQTFEYDSIGTLIKQTIFNHEGKIQNTTIYKRFEKQKLAP
jgi:hypothetical protein